MIEMAANGTTTARTRTNTTGYRTTAPRTDTARIREGLTKVRNGSVSYARHTAERSVDVPVGAALTVADRVTEIVEPFTTRGSANRELNSIRTRVQRELRQRRRRVETTMKQNRARAEDGLKRAQERVTALV